MEDKPIEGYYLETVEGLFFAVKGVVHPQERFFAYLRYVPEPQGERVREGICYRRLYEFEEQQAFLEKKYPVYLGMDPILGTSVQCVPLSLVKKIYSPRWKLAELRERKGDELENTALKFAHLLRNQAGIKEENLGVSGSLLLGLHLANSDIDLIVFGMEPAKRVYSVLTNLMEEPQYGLERLNPDELKGLYRRRSQEKALTLEQFQKTERRKVLQGKFLGREFFLRMVKEPWEVDEKYGERIYTPLGKVTIQGRIKDSSEAIFTPCVYKIEEVEILEGDSEFLPQEIVSFRGRFCEQAQEGEVIVAKGKLEKVLSRDGKANYRILLCDSEDFMYEKSPE